MGIESYPPIFLVCGSRAFCYVVDDGPRLRSTRSREAPRARELWGMNSLEHGSQSPEGFDLTFLRLLGFKGWSVVLVTTMGCLNSRNPQIGSP